jgi:AcrR family transcriptional regulator
MIPSYLSLSPTAAAVPQDGRRKRSRSSRARVVKAMLDLVAGGQVAPTAAEVAEAAGVGLRSVFRHFKDMDALYREMTEAIEIEVLPFMLHPLDGATWQERILTLAERRARIFEAIMPFRISADLRRFESAYLMEDHRRLLRLEAGALDAHLPPAVRADDLAARGLAAILSFSTWRQLRQDQGLPAAQAQAVVRRLLDDALARWPDA